MNCLVPGIEEERKKEKKEEEVNMHKTVMHQYISTAGRKKGN